MNRLAELQELLKFFDKNIGGGGGAPNAYQRASGFVGGGGESRPGLRWAQDMMGMAGHNPTTVGMGAAPDFFDDDDMQEGPRNALAAFVRPSSEGAGPMPARPEAAYDVPPRGIRRDTPMRGRANNMVAQLMRGR